MTLVDAMAATLLFVMLSLAAMGVGTSVSPSTLSAQAMVQLAADIERAHDMAPSYSDGITLYVQIVNGSSQVTAYDERPMTGTAQGNIIFRDQLNASIALGSTANTSFALFIDKSGHIDYSTTWTPWQIMASAPGNCGTPDPNGNDTVAVVADVKGGTLSKTLSCESGTIQ